MNTSKLPPFAEDGTLPQGDYAMTLDQLQASVLVTGSGDSGDSGTSGVTTWDAAWRGQLVQNLRIMIEQLWAIGIDEIFIDGSFVEDKDHPNDIDGYFVCDIQDIADGTLTQKLNQLDPAKCWTWDHAARRAYRGYPKKQLPMWHIYRVEMYPHFGQFAGKDELGNDLEFPAFFRKCRRSNKPKGIIQIVKDVEKDGK